MLRKLQLRTPGYDHRFQIQNRALRQPFTWWAFQPDYEAVELLDDLGISTCSPKLDQILRLVGSYATLWIGDWEGKIAPMDVVPEGWTYPSGRLLEREWWSQWYLCDRTESQAVEFINMNPFEASKVHSPFKSGLPFQMQHSLGKVSSISAIEIQRLPDLVHKDIKWIFEWDVDKPE
ncbi:hypothetical protein ACQ4M3_13020 [Leptolyngbya sp. AN03gr2]|uniref:hypothetical protein n=1 Tax=unclassified Leptolyngbya TaxID=2650499 RepID=UPI003D317935